MTLGDDIKNFYENRYRLFLPRHTPVLMRLDGKAFHTLTKNCARPFDSFLSDCMDSTAIRLCKEIMGAKCAYVQSDEITILITDYAKQGTEAWFDYNLAKMCSISSSVASVEFTNLFGNNGYFDSRVFSVPREMVAKNFSWRQRDWFRNSLQMYSRSFYSHKDLMNKNQTDMHEMLHDKGENWANLEDRWKNGRFIVRVQKTKWIESIQEEKEVMEWQVLPECPIFQTQDDEVINELLK